MKCFVLDMDGTVYLGEKAIPGAVEFISELNRRGIKYRFLTNNSSNRRDAYSARLKRLGFDVEPSSVLTSTVATIRYILKNHPGKSVAGNGGFRFCSAQESLDLAILCLPDDNIINGSFRPDIAEYRPASGRHDQIRAVDIGAAFHLAGTPAFDGLSRRKGSAGADGSHLHFVYAAVLIEGNWLHAQSAAAAAVLG